MPGEQSRINGRKGGMPQRENLIEGLVNLDTGEEPVYRPSAYWSSMKAAAHELKIDPAILKEAKAKACPAFGSGGSVHKGRMIKWLKDHIGYDPANPGAITLTIDPVENDFTEQPEENYTVTDEAGGVGQTLKSLQAYERKCKWELDQAEKINSTNPASPGYMHPSIKAERVKGKQDAWIKVVNALLKYDLNVAQAKRESGELIPLADANAGVQALLAWLAVANSDALRNVIPDCEGKDKYQIAALLDPALRSSSYRNFKLGMKLGKIPEWMGNTAIKFIEAPSEDVNDY